MSASAADLTLHSRPAPVALLIGAVALVALAYRDTAVGLFELWLSPDTVDYSHGILLLGISVLLAGLKLWREPDALQVSPSILGAAALALTAIAWGVSSLLLIEVGARLAFWFLFPSLVLTIFGWNGIRQLWLPLVLLVFGIPVWTIFNEILRLGTAQVVTGLLGVGGITALLEGSTITLTVGKFYIADNCTGMRQLVVAMPLALLFAQWIGLRSGPSALLFCTAIGMSFLLNVGRILIVVVAGQLTEMQHYFVKEDHVSLGWGLFGVGMTVFFLTISRAIPQRWVQPAEPAGSKPLVPPVRVMGGLGVGLSMAVVLLVPFGVARLMATPAVETGQLLTLPSEVDRWTAVEARDARDLGGSFVGADEEFATAYREIGAKSVFLQIALYRSQRSGHEAVAWVNSPFDRNAWRFLSDTFLQVEAGDRRIPVREIVVVSSNGQRRVLWTWYRVAGRQSASASQAKMLGLRGLLCGRTDAISILITPVDKMDLADGRDALQSFLAGAWPSLVRQLERVTDPDSADSWC